MASVDVVVARLMARQHGLVTRAQALRLEMTSRQVQLRATSGVWVPVHRGVFRSASVAPSFLQSVLAACLAARAVASHRTAAALWGLRGTDTVEVHVTTACRHAPAFDGFVCHRSDLLEESDVTVCGAIPCATPARTLLDLGAVAPWLVRAAMEDAVHRRLVSVRALRQLVDRVGERGRNGTATLRSLLDERQPGQAATESPLEDAVLRLLQRHGLPEPVRQLPVILPGGGLARIDLAYPDIRLGIEADGLRWHGGADDLRRDHARHNRLAALGWTILRFGWSDVRQRGDELAADVSRLRFDLHHRISSGLSPPGVQNPPQNVA